jgi:hypothetical protein
MIDERPSLDSPGKLIQRFGSRATMHVVLLAFAIRFLYYSSMVTPWQALAVEMLNGLTTGLKLHYIKLNKYVDII